MGSRSVTSATSRPTLWFIWIDQAELERLGYDDTQEFNNALKNMQQAMKRARRKEGELDEEEFVRAIHSASIPVTDIHYHNRKNRHIP
jgi:hypothetical protein